jgi:hypothetical protein
LIDNIKVRVLSEKHHSMPRLEIWFEDEDNIAWTYLKNVFKKPEKVAEALQKRGFKIEKLKFIRELLSFLYGLPFASEDMLKGTPLMLKNIKGE